MLTHTPSPNHANCRTWDSLRGCASTVHCKYRNFSFINLLNLIYFFILRYIFQMLFKFYTSSIIEIGSITWILFLYPHHTVFPLTAVMHLMECWGLPSVITWYWDKSHCPSAPLRNIVTVPSAKATKTRPCTCLMRREVSINLLSTKSFN